MVFKTYSRIDVFIGDNLGTITRSKIKLRRCNFMPQDLLSSFKQSTAAFIYFIFGISTLRFSFFFPLKRNGAVEEYYFSGKSIDF